MTEKCDWLTENLRQEIMLHSCRRLVQNSTIFKNLPQDSLSRIISALQLELYLPNDFIFKAGAPGDCMYFLDTGTVAVFTPTGKEVKIFLKNEEMLKIWKTCNVLIVSLKLIFFFHWWVDLEFEKWSQDDKQISE